MYIQSITTQLLVINIILIVMMTIDVIIILLLLSLLSLQLNVISITIHEIMDNLFSIQRGVSNVKRI